VKIHFHYRWAPGVVSLKQEEEVISALPSCLGDLGRCEVHSEILTPGTSACEELVLCHCW
jgi:hypothetical protein